MACRLIEFYVGDALPKPVRGSFLASCPYRWLEAFSLKKKRLSAILGCKTFTYIEGCVMARTMTIDTGEELRDFVESLVASGSYKTNSEVVREGLRLLQEKQAASKLETLRRLIDEAEDSGEPVNWDVDEFMGRMKKHRHGRK